MRRGHRVLLVVIAILVIVAAAVVGARWALRPDNLARVITGWVERELQAQLTLSESPGLRLVPRLELTLAGVRLERGGTLLASAEELRVALPWSMLWSGGVRIESLALRAPVIDWAMLRTLISELSDTGAPSRAPRLPEIAVGVRVEDGVLLSGSDERPWRLDRIALVTTPMHDGETFHLDTGARLAGTQSRTLSLTLSARPRSSADALTLEDIRARVVISPDGRPLADGMAVSLEGSVALSDSGLAAMSLGGEVPGWPDWLPSALGFTPDQPIALDAALPEGSEQLSLALRQADHEASADIHVADIMAAAALAVRPLAAVASLRSRWRIDALGGGGVRVEGVRITIGDDGVEDARDVDSASTPAAEPLSGTGARTGANSAAENRR